MSQSTEHQARLEEVLGFPPFPWQTRLLQSLLRDEIPRAIDLPTGLGKTAVMATWLAARSLGARRLPRRLVYVVDRRAIVDQATREAEKLRVWTEREEISRDLGLNGRPLALSTLRGRFVDNREWLDDPSRLAIVVGTVDMIGSRLLFQGYSCSRKMRPYHAALLGCDTLFVLDEAHLVPPFERLLEEALSSDDLCASDPADRDSIPRARTISLSATGRDHAEPFRLDEDDRSHEIIRRRLTARKVTSLERLAAGGQLPEALAERAWQIATEAPTPVRILVYCNGREDSEKARAALLGLAKAAGVAANRLPPTELFVGGRRIRERVDAEQRLIELGFLAGSPRPVDNAFLFSTSAGEVGVDLDADHMVADVVAWERMVQRLGRVNRLGEGVGRIILIADPQAPYTDKVEALFRQLPEIESEQRDASPQALLLLRQQYPEAVHGASTPAPSYPALTRPLVESWAMTSLRDHTGRPEVQPWLRGWVDEQPQSTLVWRTGVPQLDARDHRLAQYFDACPPHTSELLETETFRVVQWLSSRARHVLRRMEDGRLPETKDPIPALHHDSTIAWLLDGALEIVRSYSLGDWGRKLVRRDREQLERQTASRTLILDARLAGLAPSGLLADRADDLPPTADENIVESQGGVPRQGEAESLGFRVLIRAAGLAEPDPRWQERLRIPAPKFFATEEDSREEEAVDRWVVVERWKGDSASEEGRSAGPAQLLEEHRSWVENELRRIGEELDLPGPLLEALRVAALLHDEGKRSTRWQAAFSAPPGAAYAKTRGPLRLALLDGYRHELGSLALAENDDSLERVAPDLRELTLHLIAAHHGSARPTIEVRGCDDAPPSLVEERARQVALRYIDLQERWGPWGLAWLESLLRAADQRASRRNHEREGR